MIQTYLDNVSYLNNNLISQATVYAYNGEQVVKIGVWHRDDIINAIKNGLNISRAVVSKNALGGYVGQLICSVKIMEIDGKEYLKNADYCKNQYFKEDMIERNDVERRMKEKNNIT